MAEITYTPSFNSPEYTFKAGFSETTAFYSGLSDVWIGDGTPIEQYIDQQGATHYKGGIAGFLYGIYDSGTIDELGFVSDYEAAKNYLPDITYEQWVQLLAATPENANKAETQANRAAIWAAGTSQGDGSATNNARFWAEQAKSYSDGKSLDDTTTIRGTDNAEYYKNLAAQSATNAANSASTATTKASEASTSAINAANSASAAAISATSASNSASTATTKANEASTSASNASQSASSAATSASTASTKASEAAASAATASTKASEASSSASVAQAAAASITQPTTEVLYANHTNGTNPPSSGWSSSTTPVKGQYLWTKVTITWPDQTPTVYYDVSYLGLDGVGSVNSVNNKVGNVILYSTDIALANNDSTTIAQKLDALSTAITNTEIDELFT